MPQKHPAAQAGNARQLAIIGESREHANRCSLAETADYDPPRVNSGLDFCGYELIDGGYGAQHAVFVFVCSKVETLDVEPAKCEPDNMGAER